MGRRKCSTKQAVNILTVVGDFNDKTPEREKQIEDCTGYSLLINTRLSVLTRGNLRRKKVGVIHRCVPSAVPPVASGVNVRCGASRGAGG